VRWTIGDVSDRGFEALRLSMWGMWRLFGPAAAYAVCVNTIPLEQAKKRAGGTPEGVVWRDATHEVPAFLRQRFNEQMAEGVGWKLAPVRVFPERYEISLDNDCILWGVPTAMRQWLCDAEPSRCLIAEDVRACFGQFAELCGTGGRNLGIRGLPPGFDLEAVLCDVLGEVEGTRNGRIRLTSELDEQGLQTAALSRIVSPRLVTLDDVTVCSPFYPHLPHLGRCGAHFVGLNARHIEWNYYDRPADGWMAEHWQRHRGSLYEKTGTPGCGVESCERS
ncbi:MAG: hypothetical protein ACM359_02690, partial [Bacillota bacterium]